MPYITIGGTDVLVGGAGSTPPSPGPVTLGTPKLEWEHKAGRWHAVINVPVTAPSADANFDRMFVFLQAPDTRLGTGAVKSTIDPSDAVGGTYVDDDPVKASRLEDIDNPEYKAEIPWKATEPIIRVSHPEPAAAENWRVIVVSGTKYVQMPVTGVVNAPSVVVNVTPHPNGAVGEEVAPSAHNVGVSASYFSRRGAERFWRPKVTWVHPVEYPRYDAIASWDIVVFNPQLENLPDTPGDDRYTIVANVPKNATQWTGQDDWRVPDEPIPYTFTVLPVTSNGATNTIVTGVAQATVTVQWPDGQLSDDVANQSVRAAYEKDPATGHKVLALHSTWEIPDDPRYGGVVLDLSIDGGPFERISGTQTGTSYRYDFPTMPTATIVAQVWFRSVDSNNQENDNGPTASVTILAPEIGAPLSHATNFSVTAEYLSADYYGKKTLKLTPLFVQPADPAWAYAELWARREDSTWYLIGYPTGTGKFSILERLPATTASWLFALVSQDVDSRNRDGDVDTTPGVFPSGTPTFSLSVPAATGSLDGAKVTGIPAASFAAGLTGMYMGSGLPAMPNALYPIGTPFVLTTGTQPELYRSLGSSWTKNVDAANVINAHLLVAGSVVAGAIGTVQLATTEILVGPGSNRPVRFVVRDLSNTLLAMIGDDPGNSFQGAYFRNVKIAPGIASTDKCILADSTGVRIKGAEISIDASGYTTLISNFYDSSAGYYAGVRVTSNGTNRRALLHSTGVSVIANSGVHNVRLLSDFNDDGSLILYTSSGFDNVVLQALAGGSYLSLTGAAGQVKIDGTTVLRKQQATRPTDLAGLIALMVYHGFCA